MMNDYIYDKLFSSIRHKPINFLEIGISDGKSLVMFSKYFNNLNSCMYGIDITLDMFDKTLCQQLTKQPTLFCCDIANPVHINKLKQYWKNNNITFNIIVDHGSNIPERQYTNFETLFFDCLSDGGIYIIENVGGNVKNMSVVSVKDIYGHDVPITKFPDGRFAEDDLNKNKPLQFLKLFSEAIYQQLTGIAGHAGNKLGYYKNIKNKYIKYIQSIEIYPSVFVFHKRSFT